MGSRKVNPEQDDGMENTRIEKNSKYLDPDYKGEPLDPRLEDGPVGNRRCTDCLCCIIFIVFIFVWFAVGFYGFETGDPLKLTFPYDYNGNQCGAPGDAAEDYHFIYFPFPLIGYTEYTACVKSCPETYLSVIDCYLGGSTNIWKNCEFRWEDTFSIPNLSYGNIKGIYPSDDYVGRICLPLISEAKDWVLESTEAVSKVIDLDTVTDWIGDVWTARWAILMVAGAAVIISVVYLILLKLCIGVIVWLSILLCFSILLLLGFFFHWSSKNQYQEDNDEDTSSSLYWLGIIFYSASGVFLLYILCMCNRIRLAIAIMKTGTIYIRDVWVALLVPPFFILFTVLIYVYWVMSSLYLYSAGDISQEDHDAFAEVSKDQEGKYAFYFEFWGILWINAFIIAYAQFILAGSVCIWYFAYGSDAGPQRPVSRPIWWGLRYHLGSLAFGSFILAVVWTIKYTLAYIKGKLTSGNMDQVSVVVKFLINCLSCYILCFERFIKFLNKNAYIQIALHSVSFCAAARDSFFLILRNAGRFLALGAIGSIFMFLGKWLISLTATYVGYMIITRAEQYKDELHSPVFPMLIFFLISYVIASLFMGVYSMACDTILHCFLADEELCTEHGRPPAHSPPNLKSFLDSERKKNQRGCCC